MRKIFFTLCIIAGGVGTLAALISGHLMEDQRRHIAYEWLLLCIPLTLFGLIPTIVNVWRDSPPKKTTKPQRIKRGERRAFGVFWDADLHPLCPVCKTPLILSTKNLIYPIDLLNNTIPPPPPIPHCLKCNEALPLYDDHGKLITLVEAKKLLSDKEAKTEIASAKSQPLQLQIPNTPQNLDSYTTDETAINLLELFRDDLPDDDLIHESFFTSYHQLLTDIQNETKHNLARFFIPESELKPKQISRREPRMGNRPAIEAAYSKDRFCARHIFLFALDRAISYLKQNLKPKELAAKLNSFELQNAHHQSTDSYNPDKTAIEILKQIDKQITQESELARILNLEASHIRNSSGLLEKHGYIRLHRPKNLAPYYQLTQKGIDLLHKPIRTVPFPSGHDLIDETKSRILQYLADPNCRADEQAMSIVLKMHPTRLQVHLTELAQHDYVAVGGVNEWFETTYCLTTKAKRFLIERNLIP